MKFANWPSEPRTTTEIAETINTMRERRRCGRQHGECGRQSSKGVEARNKPTRPIRQIGEGSRSAVGMVEEIASAIREQATAMNNIAMQVERIAQMS